MNAHNVNHNLYLAQAQIADPGAGGTIRVDKSLAICKLTSLTAESRTLDRPLREGAIITLQHYADAGDITLTVTGGFNEDGDTSFTFSDPGQFMMLQAFFDGTVYFWRKFADHATANIPPGVAAALDGITATAVEINHLAAANAVLSTLAGTGITGGVGTVIKTSVFAEGALIYTALYLDVTGLQAIATDGDIIGDAANPAYLGRLTLARNGVMDMGLVTCMEAPAGASADINFVSAIEATGKKDDAISGLTGVQTLVDAAGAWTNGLAKGMLNTPITANNYLYITNGAGANAGTYTAGKFLIEIWGT